MSPDDSPVDWGRGGIRRLNNVPVWLIFGVIVIVFAVAFFAAENLKPKPKGKAAQSSATEANGKERLKSMSAPTGRLTPPAPTPAQPSAPATVNHQVASGGTGSYQPATPPPPSKEQLQEEAREKARRAEFAEAVHAKTAVSLSGVGSGAPASSPLAANLAIPQASGGSEVDRTLAQLRKRIDGLQQGSSKPDLAASLKTFDAAPSKDRWKLASKVQTPGPYELRAGSVIPAIMVSGINSDLPGEILAQVSQDVYDTATGRYLLIPQGSRLVGSYSANIGYGQERIFVVWERIVFPDGRALDIGAMPASDGAGYGGMHDMVNNHYLRTFGSALLMSVVVAAMEYSQGPSNFTGGASLNQQQAQSAGSYLSQALGQEMGQAMSQMMEKNLNVSPTLEIRPGYRLNVMAVKDLNFGSPYRSFDYDVAGGRR